MTAIFGTDHDFLRIADVCATLGVPQDDWVLFWRWADELPDGKAVDELNSYVDVLVAERCVRPGDDAVSQLIASDMAADEIRASIAALVANPTNPAEDRLPSAG